MQDRAVTASHELWGPWKKQPTAVEILLVSVLNMMTGFRFLNEIKLCDIADDFDIAALCPFARCPVSGELRIRNVAMVGGDGFSHGI